MTEYDNLIFQEMLVHPAFFTHPHAKKLAIIGNENAGVLNEALKHPTLAEIWHISNTPPALQESCIHHYNGNGQAWLKTLDNSLFDLIIVTDPTTFLADYFHILERNGMLIQMTESIFHSQHIKAAFSDIQQAGFRDLQILHFPQPSFPSGWRAAIMATKEGMFRRIREKDIFNKSFPTHYYNFDVHRAALALPEFMREEYEITV
jgi:spermidine synthase